MTHNVAATVASLPGGTLTDRRNAIQVLGLGIAAFLVAYVLFGGIGANVAVLLVGFTLAGIGIGFVETAEAAAVASLAPEEVRGSAFGLLAGVQSLGNLAASGVAGILWTTLSPSLAFGWLAAWMVLALSVFLTTPMMKGS